MAAANAQLLVATDSVLVLFMQSKCLPEIQSDNQIVSINIYYLPSASMPVAHLEGASDWHLEA